MKNLFAILTILAIVLTIEGGGTPKKEDVPKYIAALKSSNPTDRAKGAEMIGKRGRINLKDVENAVDPLKMLLKKDSDPKVRAAAAVALGQISTDPEGVIPLLTSSLKEKDYTLRMAAVGALENYGPAAKEAVPSLRELQKELNDKKNAKIIGAAIQAIQGKKKN